MLLRGLLFQPTDEWHECVVQSQILLSIREKLGLMLGTRMIVMTA